MKRIVAALFGGLLAGCGGGDGGSTSAGDVLSWGAVNDFAYQLQQVNLAAMGKTAFDLAVIDYSRDGSEAQRFTAAEIAGLQQSPGGPKLVLAYLSIGEAENYRWYWNSAWVNAAGTPTAAAPAWLGPVNPDWPGNYKVRYWDPAWQSILWEYLDKILAAGFDGVYLDIIDAYEYWGATTQTRTDMIALVKAIAKHARVTMGWPSFAVIPQNGEGLASDPEYVATVTGIGREDVWFVGNTPRSAPEGIPDLDIFKAAGKIVLVIDYVTEQAKIDDFYSKAKAKGYVPYATVRALDKLTINPGHPPD